MQANSFEAQCVSAMVTVIGLGAILTGSEFLCLRREWSESGLFSWSVIRTRFPFALRSGLIVLLDALYKHPRCAVALVVQILCGLALVSHAFEKYTFALLVTLLVAHLISTVRFYGFDGADQMQTILLFALVCYFLTPEPLLRKVALWFVSLQLLLAYFTAGVVKLWSKPWRSGVIFRQSLAIGSGSEFLYQCLPNSPWLSRALCWSVIAFECTFPLALFATPTACLAFVCLGVLFHAANAFSFGLPRFMFTFVAAYPALLCCTRDVGVFLR